MKTLSFQEIEEFVIEYMIHMSAEDTVKLYEHITKEQVEVEDWKN
jgi:hypothetical protein